jgi:hypothetical protein
MGRKVHHLWKTFKISYPPRLKIAILILLIFITQMSTAKYQFQKLSRQELREEAHHPAAAVQKRRRTLVPFNSKKEQHTFLPSWNDSDFTMPLEQYTFDPSWIDSDFIMPQKQHTFNPSRINADFAIPVGNFTDANIQARSEADHDDNRLSRPRFESNDFQHHQR